MADDSKVYLGTFKRAESKNGATYYWGSFGGARAVMFETKSGDGLNLYVSERPPQEERKQERPGEVAGGDSIPF